MYGNRLNGKKHGDVFTSPNITKYMLDLSEYTSDRDLSSITVIEPSCGEGEFVLEIIYRLSQSAKKYKFNLNEAIKRCLVCFDIDEAKIEKCIHKIHKFDPTIELDTCTFRLEDFLLADVEKADLIIGNPPYVRQEQIPKSKKDIYRQLFFTFRHRADLYKM